MINKLVFIGSSLCDLAILVLLIHRALTETDSWLIYLALASIWLSQCVIRFDVIFIRKKIELRIKKKEKTDDKR